ncbi:Helix-turn-helix domain protein [Rubripirellula obstinata]|uniref:Helix-turn-helix domain protein n=1 Tax=Rubripirellula obstinata TaxID=406547 RepID=A0A5B1CG25_9BACT|nr:excisionase family DNA-binding protein [Rubripirellula obstinata]KAA1258689.1 Helix-turn-helix domain protein [Rubripirellula obstinata]
MIRSLSTSEFARAIGVSDSSVRRLADAGEIEIHRTRGGHRRIPVSEAIRYVRATQTEVTHPDLLGLEVAPKDVVPESAETEILRALEAGKAATTISLMQSLYASGMSIADLCDGPIRHAMDQIGQRWPHDRRAIFVEHRATLLCARALHQLRMSMPEPDEDAPEAIGAAILGDLYLLPTLITSLVLHELGFEEINLGPNTPIDVLTDAVIEEKPDLAWLCIGEPLRSRSQALEFEKLVEATADTGTRLVIGGRHSNDADVLRHDSVIHCQTMRQLRTACLDLV